MKSAFALRIVLALLVLSAVPAFASPINIDTGKNLGLNPGASGTVTLSLTNAPGGSAITTFNAWGMILQLVPQTGATGSASFSSLLSPSTNPALTDPGDPLLDPYELNSPQNGTTSASQLSIGNNSAAVTTFALGQTYNIGDLGIQLSGDASGAWDIYALNDQNNTTSWLNDVGATTAFGNAPTAAPAAYTSTIIGTVTVVPEPSTLVMLAGAVATSGWAGLPGVVAGLRPSPRLDCPIPIAGRSD